MLQPRTASSLKIRLLFSVGILAIGVVMLLISFFDKQSHSSKMSVTVFSQPHELHPFQFNPLLFSQKNLFHHWTFLFFGFTHCSDVCPATLSTLKEVYSNLHAQYPELQVVFVSIDPQEKMADLQPYLASFNKDFIGLRGTKEQVENLKQQFGVHAALDTHSSTLSHTSSIFLINPQGQWLALFPYGLRSKQMQDQFKIIVENYSHV